MNNHDLNVTAEWNEVGQRQNEAEDTDEWSRRK